MTASANELTPTRSGHIAAVLEGIVSLSRSLASPRTTPFGDAALTRTQLEILFLLAHAAAPIAPGQLATTLRVTPGAITQTLDHLRDLGLVEQAVSDHDKRARVLTLTPAARLQVESFEASTVLKVAPWFTALSDDELSALAGLIARVEAA